MTLPALAASTPSDLPFLEAAIGSANDSISVHEFCDDGPWPARYIYVNDCFVRRTGYSLDEIAAGSTPLLLGPKTSRELFDGVIEDMRAGIERMYEAEFFRKDGSSYWAEVRSAPLRDTDGTIRRYITICRDITERRRAEAERRTLYHAIDETTDFVLMFDATPPSEGGPFVTYVNGAYLHASGYAMDEIMGRSYTELLSDNNDSSALAHLRDNIENLRHNAKEVEIRRRDGSCFWIEFTSAPVRNSSGIAAHWIAVGRDITARRQVLRQGALLAQAFDALGDAVTLYALEAGEPVLFLRNEAAIVAGHDVDIQELTRAATSRQKTVLGDGTSVTPLCDVNGGVAGLMAVAARRRD